jgi:hypothetical protein
VFWEKIVFETNKQAVKKVGVKVNRFIAGKIWTHLTYDELLHFIGILMHVFNVQYANRGYRY